jgi:hypothetical protein
MDFRLKKIGNVDNAYKNGGVYMGFNLIIEGQEKLSYNKEIIGSVQASLSSPSNSRAKSTNNYMTLVISGKLHADKDGTNSETFKLFKWAQVPAEKEEAYCKVIVQVVGEANTNFRTITLDKAFVVDYNEIYSSQAGVGNFNIVIRQKADTIDDVNVESDPASVAAPGVSATADAAAGTPGDFVSAGPQAGVMNNIGRAAVTAALNKVDPSGTAASVLQAGLDKNKQ